MAGVEVGGVIVNMSGGRLASRRHGADAALIGKTVAERDHPPRAGGRGGRER